MPLVDPQFNFDFDIVEKGDHLFIAKEANVDEPKEGSKLGHRFWVRLVVQGGSQDGLGHIESFYENKKDGTENEFAMKKLAGFLVKSGAYTKPGKINTDQFKTPAFRERWKSSIPGKYIGAKVTHRAKVVNGVTTDDMQSELRIYYTREEMTKRLAGKADPAPSQAETGAPSTTPPVDDDTWS